MLRSTSAVKAVSVALLLGCTGIQTILAGDMDTHLTSTYFIARQLGYSEADAQRIASGDWSMDLNANTNAMPTTQRTKDSWWYDRGATYHSLGTPGEISDRLNGMRSAVQTSTAPQNDKLAQLGQYLHATQDVYFHQHDGEPYGPKIGHVLQGHETDRVGAHFDAGLRANQATYDILKQFRDNGTLPNVRPTNEIYVKDTSAEVQRIASNDKTTGVLTLTDAVSKSYRSYTWPPPVDPLTADIEELKTRGVMPPRTVYVDPKPDDLRKNLNDAWNKVPHAPGDKIALPDPMVHMEPGGKQMVDYNGKEANLLLPRTNPPGAANSGGTSPVKQVPGSVPGAAVPAPVNYSPTPGPAPTPGGISLSRAAASRVAININLDGLLAGDGRIVLSGRSNGTQRVDAALFHTAVRLACEPNDPFFSLDSDNGAAWSREGQRASDAIWPRIRADYGLDDPLAKNAPVGLTVRSLSAKRDYRQLWSTLAPQFPNLKTRLVFRPEWLRFSRFGEIMYKADVLLKELDGGVPTLRPDPSLRADKVDRFASATARSAAESLLGFISNDKSRPAAKPGFHGSRLWFDLAPRVNDPRPAVSMLDDIARPVPPSQAVARSTDPVAMKLSAILSARGYVGTPNAIEPSRTLAVDGDAVDLSQVYPQMFVRAHDLSTGKDIPGSSPTLNALSEDVNRRIRQYVSSYDELQALTDAFRLYVAAVAFTKRDPGICQGVQATPLLPTERASAPLPEFHPSELYFVFATYVHANADGKKRWWMGSSGSTDGGVSPRGKEYFERESILPQKTAVTAEIRREAANNTDAPIWSGTSGREFVALIPDRDPEFIQQAEKLRAFKPVTREMVLARLQISPPAASPGNGLLDDAPTPGRGGGGLLDDVDSGRNGVVVIPGRR